MLKLISGTIATIFSVVMTLPQIYKTLKTKKTDDLSIQAIILAICCNTAWIIYAVSTPSNLDIPILTTTSILNIQQIILLVAKIKYS